MVAMPYQAATAAEDRAAWRQRAGLSKEAAGGENRHLLHDLSQLLCWTVVMNLYIFSKICLLSTPTIKLPTLKLCDNPVEREQPYSPLKTEENRTMMMNSTENLQMTNLLQQESWIGQQFFIHFNQLPFNTADIINMK